MAALEERNASRGALNLPYEQFRLIFRFLIRMQANYHTENRLVRFTLPDDQTELHRDEVMAQLHEIITASLRASDVVTRRGDQSILVLLLEANRNDSRMVMHRIQQQWLQQGHHEEFTYEMEVIK